MEGEPAAGMGDFSQDGSKDTIPRIYACATMWHETKEEMMEFLKSIMRLDEDQSSRRIVRHYMGFDIPDYYEIESKILIFFALNTGLCGLHQLPFPSFPLYFTKKMI